MYYEIKVGGTLDGRWSVWFEGFRVTNDSGGTTTLGGQVRDDAALYGLISKVRDVGLTLISVQRVEAPDVQTL